MSQATIAAGRRMSTARCYLDPIRTRANLHIETGALTEALVLDGRRCTGVRYSVGRRFARSRRRRARSWSAAARSTRRNSWSCPASASPSGCAIWASRCAMRCPASARTCATIMRRAPAGWSARGDHLQRPRPRPRHGASGAALRAVPERLSGQCGRADARVRPFARGSRSAGSVARLGPDADRTRPQGPPDIPASPASPATPIRCGRKARDTSTLPRPIRAGRRRSTSTSCRRRPTRNSPCARSASPAPS